MQAINLHNEFATIDGYWQPKVIAQLNGQYVKLAKFKGEFDWHSHAHEDEYFQVIKGRIAIEFRDKTVHLKTGECFTVPKGVEHKPMAEEEAHVMMFEPIATQQKGQIN